MNRKAFILFGAGLLAFSIARAELPATITTTDGETYKGVSLIRVEPDGYLVNYQPEGAGVGMAKIKFARLSKDLQRKGGYNVAEAQEFEGDVAEAQLAYSKLLNDWAMKAKAIEDEKNVNLALAAERQRVINVEATQNTPPPSTAPNNPSADFGRVSLVMSPNYGPVTPESLGRPVVGIFTQTPSIPTRK